MSQIVRPEDLETGVMFDVAALGTVPLGQTPPTMDIVTLQKYIRELYLNYQKPSGAGPLPLCRLVVSNRGLAVTDAPTGPLDRTPSAETLYNIPSVVFAAAVRFLIVGKKEKDFRCAFEAIDTEGPSPATVAKGKTADPLYVSVDKKWKHLTKVTSHPAICACVIQRMTGVRAAELHAFVCESDLQARDVIFCLTSALKNFTAGPSSPPIYGGHGIYDLPPSSQMGGMRNDPEHLMMSQQQARGPGLVDGVYGMQGQHPDQMMNYRGGPGGGMRQDLGGPGQWDQRPQDGRGPLGSSSSGAEGQQGSEWLSQQRDQLMRNFTNDQKKNERSQPEQGIYDQQRGAYDAYPPRGIYDPLPSRGVYDANPSKGIYDAQPSAIYEYRPPQNHPEPQRDAYAAGPPLADPYTLRRDIYDPQMGANRGQLEPPSNLMRAMSGSSERVFDEQRRGGQDLQKSNYEAVQPPRQAGGGELYGRSGPGGQESEYSTGFALPRVKVNYEGSGEAAPSNARGELIPGGEYGGGARPVSVGYGDGGRLQKPMAPTSSSSYTSLDRQSPVSQVKVKAQPPAPLAKTPRPSATSPTTEAYPGLRPSVGGGASMKSDPMDRGSPDVVMAQSSVPVAPKKVYGIRVFPTIMLRGNQAAAAAAAAAEDDGDARDAGQTSYFVENLRSTKPNGTGPEKHPANRGVPKAFVDATDDHTGGQDKRKKDDEIESAFGGLTVDPGKAGRNPANDFEQTLGYLP